MTGTGRASRAPRTRWPRAEKAAASAGVMVAISRMSAPATKAFSPAPVSTTTRRSARSAARLAISTSSSVSTAWVRAFIAFGRWISIHAMPSVQVTFTRSMAQPFAL